MSHGHGHDNGKEEDDPELGPLTEQKEIYGWWIFDFASSTFVYSVLPFLIVGLLTSMADEVAEGGHIYFLGFIKAEPESFVPYCITLSVIIQTPIFVCVGAVADVGGYRRKLLIITSIASCALISLFFFIIYPVPYWLGGALLIACNITVGCASIFYNSFLPLLVKNYPKIRNEKDPVKKKEYSERVGNRISSVGINAGFAGGALFLILNIVIFLIMNGQCTTGCHACTPDLERSEHFCPKSCGTGYDTRTCDHDYWGSRVNLILGSLWWLGFSLFTFAWLKNRVSHPLPPGDHILTHSAKKMYQLAKDCRKLPTATRFIFAYWIYTDGMNTLFLACMEYSISRLKFSFTESGVLTVFINLSAVAGNFTFLFLSKKYPTIFHSKAIVMINLAMFACMPLFVRAPGTLDMTGSTYKGQWYFISCWYGFGFASIQGFSRGILSRLAPPGSEGAFFSFFEFTNKLTSPLGPLIMPSVALMAGDWKWGVFVIVTFLIVGFLLLLTVDESKGIQEAINYVPQHNLEMSLVPTHDAESSHMMRHEYESEDEDINLRSH
eukprot:TRINITY_DN1530_c0_g1_i1.p1 TRINITY_DN1530_c0_g1~~TRINITY_DN1530_c0_g1_i1.p1  ORF type:complete len:552 (+),score=146.54 TRINITY_DN1530_c0_g1_i1:111-1766(+)